MTEAGLCMIVKIAVNTVNEILAYSYEGQRTQTDMFFRILYCVSVQQNSWGLEFVMPFLILHCILCSQNL